MSRARIGGASLLLLSATMLSGHALAQSPVFAYTVPPTNDPLLSGLTPTASAATQGMWSSVQPWPLLPIHVSILPDGRVVSFGSPDGQGIQDGRTFDFWSPSLGLGSASHLMTPNAQSIDSFCAAATILPATGQLLVSGGGSGGDAYQSFSSTVVSPASTTVASSGFPMAAQRWYGTMITLADGRPLMGGGGVPYALVEAYENPSAAAPNVSSTPEVFTPGSGWSSLFGATSTDAFGATNNRAWYPRMWVAPDGSVFGISTEKVWRLDPVADTITTLGTFKSTVNTSTLPDVGPTSTAVMYAPGKILQAGGDGYNNQDNYPSSSAATIFDITNPTNPVATDTTSMHNARQWANSLVLPDGNVLVTGGSTYGDTAGNNAVYPAEIWNPSTGQWTVEASAAVYRGYHSNTVLLPDGVVLSAGGGAPGPATNLNAEIYYPPYLFSQNGGGSALAVRPRIVSLSAISGQYSGSIQVQMADSSTIASASLIGLSTTTHSFNTFGRRVPLSLSQSGTILTMTLPISGNIAPPGYYLLTVLNSANVPSSAVIIGLDAATPVPAPTIQGPAIFSNTAGLTSVGNASTRISRGADGTTVIVNSNTGALWKFTGDNAATNISAPIQMTDVAVVNANSIYTVGVDRMVYRYSNGSWATVGRRAMSIGAASDGTVVVVSNDNTMWAKQADNNVEAWTQVPGHALRVAPLSANSLWILGLDNNVYLGNQGGNFVQAGVNARDISTSSDGHILVVNTPTNQLWEKSSNDTTSGWTNIAFTALSGAVVNGGGVVAVGTDSNVYRTSNVSMQ